jgi:alkylated DNA repair dioxygenase AlkB
MQSVNDPQMSLTFDAASDYAMHRIGMSDAEVWFLLRLFDKTESDRLFKDLMGNIIWNQETIKYYGKDINLPRLTAWYGDKETSYTYSHISNSPHPWTPTLIYIKNRAEEAAKAKFNSVLLNLYRDGNDGVSWHQDNERELGKEPVIGSVSFGQTRRFQLKHKTKKDLGRIDIDLTDGSFLIMKGKTQQFWQHQIPKTAKPVKPRINLTFRFIY